MSSPTKVLLVTKTIFNKKGRCEDDRIMLVDEVDEEKTKDKKNKIDTDGSSANKKETKIVIKFGFHRFLITFLLLVTIIALALLLAWHFASKRNTANERHEEEAQSPNRKVCSAAVFHHDLAEMNDSITYFTPPRNICFTISRSGIYYFSLSIKLSCTKSTLQQVSVTIRGETLQNPAFIINKRTCKGSHLYVSEQKVFRAHKLDTICLESYTCLDKYSGNFIILDWFKDDLH